MEVGIARKLADDIVDIKGKEKCEFISRMFPRPKCVELDCILPSGHLNSCVHERCDVRHSIHCARLKVHELRHAILQQELSR